MSYFSPKVNSVDLCAGGFILEMLPGPLTPEVGVEKALGSALGTPVDDLQPAP